MDKPVDKKPDDSTVTAQLRGEVMAYAVQNGVYNVVGNFFEPIIGTQTQKYYSSHDKSHPQHGTYGQNLLGEFAGDISGAGSLILAEALAPKTLHTFLRSARSLIDPLYTSVAHRVFAAEKDAPDYQQKVQQWALTQERNFVRSAFMATFGIAGNLGAQKYLIKNPSPTSVIFKGKLLSTAVTTALGLTARMVFPKQINGLDNAIAKKFITPMLDDVEGVPTVPVAATHVDKIAGPAQAKPDSPQISH